MTERIRALAPDLGVDRRLRRTGARAAAHRCRASAGSTCTSRCCRAGAAPRPCSAPSSRATPRPAPPSSSWCPSWTPAPSSPSCAVRSAPTRPRASCSTRSPIDGADLLADVVDALAAGTAVARRRRRARSTLAPEARRSTTPASTSTQPADAVYARLRGVTPEPGAFALLGGERFKILDAAPRADGEPPLAPGRRRGSATGGVLVGTGDRPARARHRAAGRASARWPRPTGGAGGRRDAGWRVMSAPPRPVRTAGPQAPIAAADRSSPRAGSRSTSSAPSASRDAYANLLLPDPHRRARRCRRPTPASPPSSPTAPCACRATTTA